MRMRGVNRGGVWGGSARARGEGGDEGRFPAQRLRGCGGGRP